MNVIKINGAALPVEPFSYKITKSDLYAESTGRTTETGKNASISDTLRRLLDFA